MTDATRKALEKVHHLLGEAGWGQRFAADTPEMFEARIAPLRAAFGTLMRDEGWALLRQTLGGRAVEDVGRALGLTPDQARARFADALRRLCAFAEVAEAQGFAASDAPAA